MIFEIVIFLVFAAFAITTYKFFESKVESKFGIAVVEDRLTKIMLFIIAISLPNAVVAFLVFLTGFWK